jgi:hypothetical protein
LANETFLDDRHANFLRLCAANLLMAAGLYLVKPALTDEFWVSHRPALLAAAAFWPVVCAAFYDSGLARGGLERLVAWTRRFARPLLAILSLGLAAFFVYHWIALIQIWSGVAVFRRLASWNPPLWLALPLYVWAAALLAVFFHFSLSRLKASAAQALPPYERLLIFWPLAYAAIFILFRNTSSIRYYVIPSFLLWCALAVILPRLSVRSRGLLALGTLLIYGCAWNQSAGPSRHKPLRFYIAWHLERSIDFADNSDLARLADEQRICNFPNADSFTDMPLLFLSEGRAKCDPRKSLLTEYCWDCVQAPYFKWQVLTDGRAEPGS